MKYLIAEDDAFTRKVLAAMLSPYGKINCVADGCEALEAFVAAHKDASPYDLICLDVIMPGLDGQQTLAKIREYEAANGVAQSGEVRVVMTTAVEDKAIIHETFVDLRATAYMVKPVKRDALLTILSDFGLIKGEG